MRGRGEDVFFSYFSKRKLSLSLMGFYVLGLVRYGLYGAWTQGHWQPNFWCRLKGEAKQKMAVIFSSRIQEKQ